jgi:hypothetical protein
MSVYTKAIIHWRGSHAGLETTFAPNMDFFGDYNGSCHHVSGPIYCISHPECNIFELKDYFKRVSDHRNCVDIYHRECYI